MIPYPDLSSIKTAVVRTDTTFEFKCHFLVITMTVIASRWFNIIDSSLKFADKINKIKI